MKPGRPRAAVVTSPKARRREPESAAGRDFAWPPRADDPDACSIVMLDGGATLSSQPAPNRLLDDLLVGYPDIDVDTALDAFADAPAPAPAPGRPVAVARPAAPRLPQAARGDRFSWWRGAGVRGVIALSIGASLALMPPPGPPAPAADRTVDRPTPAAPPVAPVRGGQTPASRRQAVTPISVPGPGRAAPLDEDRIRATLAELRAAYLQLDAAAARDVWPSVDVDALALAFDGLKSQELRFDRCDVAVDGARAWAACTGRATYVPRAGSTAYSSATRAWTFELTRRRERWTIASGRAS